MSVKTVFGSVSNVLNKPEDVLSSWTVYRIVGKNVCVKIGGTACFGKIRYVLSTEEQGRYELHFTEPVALYRLSDSTGGWVPDVEKIKTMVVATRDPYTILVEGEDDERLKEEHDAIVTLAGEEDVPRTCC